MRAAVETGKVVFTDVPPGRTYVDGDALPASGELEVDGVVADSDSTALEVYRARAAALLALLPEGVPAEVVGSGITARRVRALGASRADDSSPAAIVELTGDPGQVATALRRLRDLGTLVLGGAAAGRRLDLDLYADLHLRGLRVVGAPPVAAAPASAASRPDGAAGGEEPLEARAGQPAPLGAAWYRVVGPTGAGA